ncbi:MAG: hypothetical protein ACK4S2_06140 [Gemmobacter sp.]|uniref:hypothetical protein n=1 Tax=Gemmobacter sp. TaxID=1898957 RepID=UPI00391BB34E
MTILGDVVKELWSMFVGDARLTLAPLALVGAAGALIGSGLAGPGVTATLLVLGTVVVLIAAVALAARRR